MIISIFTPHGGCPERCSFCDQSVSGGEPVSVRAVVETIDEHLGPAGLADELAFYGGTFTAMPRARQLAYLEAARPYLENGRIGAVRVATRPDAIDVDWLKQLRDTYRLRTVELGAQTFNPRALKALGRSHTVSHTESAVKVLRELGLSVGLHLMIGCPEEAAGDDALAIDWLEKLKPDTIRIHPLLVLKGTVLETMVATGRLAPLSLEEAIERAARLVNGAEKLGIKVIRLGLQPNELLSEAIVAGPYHPAFGDLVRGRILRTRLSARLGALRLKNGDGLELVVPQELEGRLKGPSTQNLRWIKTRFNLSEIRVRVVKGARLTPPLYDEIEVRIHHSPGPSERRQVEPSQ